MRRTALITTLASLAIFFCGPASAELPSLIVTVNNAATTDGTIEVSLFNSSESFMKEVFLQQSGEVDDNGEFIAAFASLLEGEYAVVVVHDENGNGEYDSGFLGFGGEGLGYSNNIRPLLGRPDFDEVKLELGSAPIQIEISLQ